MAGARRVLISLPLARAAAWRPRRTARARRLSRYKFAAGVRADIPKACGTTGRWLGSRRFDGLRTRRRVGYRSSACAVGHNRAGVVMPALPWTTIREPDRDGRGVRVASMFRLRLSLCQRGFFAAALRIRREVRDTPGAVGLALDARPISRNARAAVQHPSARDAPGARSHQPRGREPRIVAPAPWSLSGLCVRGLEQLDQRATYADLAAGHLGSLDVKPAEVLVDEPERSFIGCLRHGLVAEHAD
jgi:hypothetical protein